MGYQEPNYVIENDVDEMEQPVIQKPAVSIKQNAVSDDFQPIEKFDASQEIIDEILADKSNYSLGNPNGKYVIIEFFDHKCGWCKRTNDAMRTALAKPENKNIRWVPIDTPIFGEQSETIARFVLAAGKQGKYAEMHEAVGTAKSFTDADFIKMGRKIGLDTDKLVADANSEELKAKLVKNQEYAGKLNINGVPMLIVNGRINPGALLGEKLEKALQEAREMK